MGEAETLTQSTQVTSNFISITYQPSYDFMDADSTYGTHTKSKKKPVSPRDRNV